MRTSSKILMGLQGVLLIAIGVICLINYQSTLAGISYLIGIFFMAAGVASLCTFFSVHGFLFNSGNLLISGLFEILIGCLFMGKNSETVAAILPYLFGFMALVAGSGLAIHSFDFKQVHFKYWWLLLILGIAAAALGIVSLFIPKVGGVSISILVGIAFILAGLAYITALFGINKFEKNIRDLIKY